MSLSFISLCKWRVSSVTNTQRVLLPFCIGPPYHIFDIQHIKTQDRKRIFLVAFLQILVANEKSAEAHTDTTLMFSFMSEES